MNKYSVYVIAILTLGIGVMLGAWLVNNNELEHAHEGHESIEQNQEFTCSMHPEVRLDAPGDCPICSMSLIPVSFSPASREANELQMTEEAIKLANIQTLMVEPSETIGNYSIQFNGKIKSNEIGASHLVTHISGRIEVLFVNLTGSKVKKGQKIATLYSPEWITAQKELLEAQKMQHDHPELFEATQRKLINWKISRVLIDRILTSKTIQNTVDIFADHSGTVLQRNISVGDYVPMGGILFEIQDLSTLWAVLEVYERDLSKIKMGDKLSFSTPSITNHIFETTISFIEPIVQSQTRIVEIKAEVDNKNNLLKPEMFITGSIQIAHKADVILLPKSAVLWTGVRSVVYVKKNHSKIPSFEYREIEIDESFDDQYLVLSGLNVGEEIVVQGAFVIDAAAQLNNQTSMMNQKTVVKNKREADPLPDYSKNSSQKFRKYIKETITYYLLVKDALVNSESKQANVAVRKLITHLDKKNIDLEGIKNDFWMNQRDYLMAHSKKITVSEDLVKQRIQFDFLSNELIKTLKVFGTENDTLYVQFCPMANDYQHANWISLDTNILNPFFGSKMLTCGLVVEKIY